MVIFFRYKVFVPVVWVFWLVFAFIEANSEDTGYHYNAFMSLIVSLGVTIFVFSFFVFKQVMALGWAFVIAFLCYLIVGIVASRYCKNTWGSGFLPTLTLNVKKETSR